MDRATRIGRDALTAVGHRVVHGGPKYSQPERITAEIVEELHRLSPFDTEHLPEEILLTEAFHRRFLDLPQLAFRVLHRIMLINGAVRNSRGGARELICGGRMTR